MKTYTGLELIKHMAELQTEIVEEICEKTGEHHYDGTICFESQHGDNIINPFLSECMRFEVDPVEYYGDAFMNSEWKKFL